MKKINNKIAVIIILVVSIILGSLVIYKLNNSSKNNAAYDYSKEELEQIPTTDKKIKNVIFMLGDGMGENHIIAGSIYKGEELNIQKIENKAYVKTASTTAVTDSAAAATALATGYKTNNSVVGKDPYGKDLENIIEYTNKKGLKTGIVCTQILNHSTPASFSVHNNSRHNYDEIAQSQIQSCVDLMLGGGRKYFTKYQNLMSKNGFVWINSISELNKVDKNSKVIGTFANESLSKEENRVSLADLSKEAFSRLENDNGFFLMIEGSDIDAYGHKLNLSKTLIEIIDFDEAVKVAKEYVDEHPDTLLIVTADHESGGLVLDGVTDANQLTDSLYTSGGDHTDANVLVYAYGIGAEDLTQYDIIDNTSIHKFVKQGITNNYEK